MSAFDRIQNYSASKPTVKEVEKVSGAFGDTLPEFFDKTTPTGYFLSKLHQEGYAMLEDCYIDQQGKELSKEQFEKLLPDSQLLYVKKTRKSELCNVLETTGDQLIISSAGSGKTTALVYKIMLDIANGEATKLVSIPDGTQIRVVDDIFVGTFLKSGADELKERLTKEQRRFGYTITADRINFSTLHAEFYRVLSAMNVPIKIGEERVLNGFIKKAIDGLGVTRDGATLSGEDYFTIQGIITYCRGRLDAKRYNHPSCADYCLTPIILDKIILDYKIQKDMAGIKDFEDLQDLLYTYLYIKPNKAVQDFVANRYKYIYLDEFQDTSQVQYAIIMFYVRGRLRCNKLSIQKEGLVSGMYTGLETNGKIVAIGDPDQTIYTWRGSDVDIISSIFDIDFAPCISIMSRNYRCPSNILNPIIKSIVLNSKRYNFPLKSAREGGEFYAYSFSSIQAMLTKLSADIEDDVSKGHSIAIICRTNFDGMIPAFMLEMEHKYNFSVSSDNMTLSSPLPRKILAMTSLFTERSTMNVRNSLEMFVSRYSTWKVKELVQTLKNDESSQSRGSIWTMSEADIEYSCPELLDFVKAVKSIIIDENGKRDRAQEIEALRFVYKYLKVNSYSGESSYCASARAYIDALLYMLDTKEFTSVFDFQEEVNGYNDKLKARIRKKDVKISIVTVHEFKGKERDSTYVWNDSQGIFPSNKTDENDLGQMEEERRVHYIAFTRAKKKNTVYCLKGKQGRFLVEMGVETPDPIGVSGKLEKSPVAQSTFNSRLHKEEDELMDKLASISFNDSIPKM